MNVTLVLSLSLLAGAAWPATAWLRAPAPPAAPPPIAAPPTLQLDAAVANPHVDFGGFLQDGLRAQLLRRERLLTWPQFAAAAGEPGTIVLDARSADRYRGRHIAGARNLPFTDFTAPALAQLIPTRSTKVLIYCNNNFRGDERAFPSKVAVAALNISTFIALLSYGYDNVWELGPMLDVADANVPWSGTEVR